MNFFDYIKSFFPSVIKIKTGTDRKTVGIIGENIAAAYLRRHGYKILERNYRLENHEIDIIAKKGKTIIFVEVKTRKMTDEYSPYHSLPRDAVVYSQKKSIGKAARCYIKTKQLGDIETRFDIMEIYLKKPDNADYLKIAKTEHIENAFRA